MRLLICTQVLDKNDPALGFFVAWVSEFAQRFEKIIVVCLYRGVYELPENVQVFSLGKEHVKTKTRGAKFFQRCRYIFRFKKLIWRKRHEYDAVLVHMNAEYAVIGGVMWRLLGKKTALWYNHPARHWKLKIGARLVHRIFYTSEKSASAVYGHARRMPVGIDPERFSRDPSVVPKPRSILSLGRISVYKRIHVLIEGLQLLYERGVSFTTDIYGNAPPEERVYGETVREKGKTLADRDIVHWYSGVSHETTRGIFNAHHLFVNLSQAGNFDKTILEAMACESLILTCNPVLKQLLPPECFFREDDAEDFAEKVEKIFSLSEAKRNMYGKQFRAYVLHEHTLEKLAIALEQSFRDSIGV